MQLFSFYWWVTCWLFITLYGTHVTISSNRAGYSTRPSYSKARLQISVIANKNASYILSRHFQNFLANEQSFKGQILFNASMLISVMNLNMTQLFQVRLKFKPDPLPRNTVLFCFIQPKLTLYIWRALMLL